MSITKKEVEGWIDTAPQKQVRKMSKLMLSLMTEPQIRKIDSLFSKKITFSVPRDLEPEQELKSIKNAPRRVIEDLEDAEEEDGDENLMLDPANLNLDDMDDMQVTPEEAEEEFDEVVSRKPVRQ